MKIRKAFSRTLSADFQSVVFSTELEIEVPDDASAEQAEAIAKKQIELATRAAPLVQRRVVRLIEDDIDEALDDKELRELIYRAQDRQRHD